MSARFSKTIALTLPLLTLGLTLSLSSQSSTGKPAASSKYIGAAKCKNCHNSKESGDQYAVWSKANHSHAYEGLQSAEAKELAAKLGIADPTKDNACLRCHVTAFGEPEEKFARGWDQKLGVQCETCHGPGDDHMKVRFKAAAVEKPKGYQAVPESEVITSTRVEVCVKCHNPQSPSYKPFCYYEARAKIAHLDPRKPRSDEEKANYGKCSCGTPCPHAEGCPEGKCNLKPEELAAMKK